MIGWIFSMFAGIRSRSRAMWRDSDGAAAVIMAICLPVIVSFAALAIDMSYAYWTRTQLQHAASAAALAGASQLKEVNTATAVKLEAVAYADKNMDPALHGTTLLATDVILGHWDPANGANAGCFIAMGMTDCGGVTACSNPVPVQTNPGSCAPIDAVWVRTRRAQPNGNSLNLFLGAYVGLAETDISTVAIAWNEGGGNPPPDCFQNGMIAGGWLRMQGENAYTNDYCLYGRDGVQVQSDNAFDDGVTVGYGPDGYLDEQGGPNPGLDAAIMDPPKIVEPLLAQNIDNMMGDLESGDYPTFIVEDNGFNESGGIWEGSQAEWEAISPTPHTTYIVHGEATIDSYVSNIVVIADKISVDADIDHAVLIAKPPSPELIDGANIDIGSWVDMDYIVLAAYNRINLGSSGSLGGGLCDGVGVTVQVFAKEDVVFQSDIDISNAQIAAGRDVNMESNNAINLTGDGATIQAIGDIKLQSTGTYGACSSGGGGEPPPGPTVSLDLRIVD